jgi:quercetin dioxygenase-like cupin family protein
MVIAKTWIVAAITAVAFVGLAHGQDGLDPKNRQELKRADVSGTNMEIIISVVENQPGEIIPRHIHHGEEAFYVLQGQHSKHQTGSRSNCRPGQPPSMPAMFHMPD